MNCQALPGGHVPTGYAIKGDPSDCALNRDRSRCDDDIVKPCLCFPNGVEPKATEREGIRILDVEDRLVVQLQSDAPTGNGHNEGHWSACAWRDPRLIVECDPTRRFMIRAREHNAIGFGGQPASLADEFQLVARAVTNPRTSLKPVCAKHNVKMLKWCAIDEGRS